MTSYRDLYLGRFQSPDYERAVRTFRPCQAIACPASTPGPAESNLRRLPAFFVVNCSGSTSAAVAGSNGDSMAVAAAVVAACCNPS